MKSNREIKLAEIKNHSPSLYQKVVDGDVTLIDDEGEKQGGNEFLPDFNLYIGFYF